MESFPTDQQLMEFYDDGMEDIFDSKLSMDCSSYFNDTDFTSSSLNIDNHANSLEQNQEPVYNYSCGVDAENNYAFNVVNNNSGLDENSNKYIPGKDYIAQVSELWVYLLTYTYTNE